MSEREFDVLLWGVTSWTGVHLLEHFVKYYPLDGSQKEVNWAVVARNEEKLSTVLKQTSEGYKAPWLLEAGSFIVDNDDERKINDVVPRAKVVATLVGPYAKYGGKLLKACIEHGTHYADVTGELKFAKDMIQKYDGVGERKGVFMVPFSGVDSVPSDLTTFASVTHINEKLMERDQKVIEKRISAQGFVTKSELNNRKSKDNYPGISTARSLLDVTDSPDPYILTDAIDKCKDDINHMPQALVGRAPKELKDRKWTAPFFMAKINEKVVRRSRFLLSNLYGNSFSYREALASETLLGAVLICLLEVFLLFILQFEFCRNLLDRNLPKETGIPRAVVNDPSYTPGHVEFVSVVSAEVKFENGSSEIIKSKTTLAFGDEMGYAFTALSFGEIAVILAKQVDEVKEINGISGGVITPAVLGKSLIRRMTTRGASIEVEGLN